MHSYVFKQTFSLRFIKSVADNVLQMGFFFA